MSVKTLPLNPDMLGGQTPAVFFGITLPQRQLGRFYIMGRPDYIARSTPAGTLVLFHLGGRIVAHARLRPAWLQPNNDPLGHPDALASYLLDNPVALEQPLGHAALPAVWQAKWTKGRFDNNPRTLDDQYETAFLAMAV